MLAPTILIPAAAGMAWRVKWPANADRLSAVVTAVSNVTFVIAVIVGIAGDVDALWASLQSWTALAALLILVPAGLISYAVPAEVARRRAGVLITANRATSVAILVLAPIFGGTPQVVITAVVFGSIQTVGVLALSVYWRLELSRSKRPAAI